MSLWTLKIRIALASLSLALNGLAAAGPIEVEPIHAGSGLFSSFVQIDFNTGDTFVFEVAWSNTTTGFELLQVLQAEVGLQLDADYFDFDGDGEFTDAFVTELGFAGHVHTAPPDFSAGWNYYNRDSSAAMWESSFIGVSDREVFDGSWDGWTFGAFPGAQPRAVSLVPTPGAAMLGIMVLMTRRRRRG